MLSSQFQSTHTDITEIGNNLLLYLKEFRGKRLTEGDSTESLESVEHNIKKALKALKEQKYEVAVVAPMKAGKSTFLNAIIGADVLASESAACTICRTDIRHIDKNQTPRLLEYQASQKHPNIIAEGNAEIIQQKFLARTREIRETDDVDNKIPDRFELEYPIEAIGSLPALSGFTLIDTPGPNEWQSEVNNVSALKQASLEALRTCKAVLFILNYRSFKDNAVNELFESITKNRKELLAESSGRIYFILNQVDLKSERDPDIQETLEYLKKELTKFGFPNPRIFPTSALQGLLAKLIHQKTASENQTKDFKKFFSAQYSQENEDGDMITPAPHKIAQNAIEDSGIIAIQDAVFQTVVQTAGWNLLSDVLNQLDKAAKSTESTLNVQISGWEMKVDELIQKVQEYEKKQEVARQKIQIVRDAIETQKNFLMEVFGAGIDTFSVAAKDKIKEQISSIANYRKDNSFQGMLEEDNSIFSGGINNPLVQLFSIREVGEIASNIIELIPSAGKQLSKLFRVAVSLAERLNRDGLIPHYPNTEKDPFIIEFKCIEDAQNFSLIVNSFCAPYIQDWWTDVQDRLIIQGKKSREILSNKIQLEIQEISDDLSKYVGETLHTTININPIQFPQFEFRGIDEILFKQQEVFKRAMKKEKRIESRCCTSDRVYYVDVEVEEKDALFILDLNVISDKIQSKIDEQIQYNKQLLSEVVKKQVDLDFNNAKNQIEEYMNKFQIELENIIEEKNKNQEKAPVVTESLNQYKDILRNHLKIISDARVALDKWKPFDDVVTTS